MQIFTTLGNTKIPTSPAPKQKTFLGELLGTAKDAALIKGKSLINDVINNPTSVSLLPKTQASKQAEQLIRGYTPAESSRILGPGQSISFGNPMLILGVILLIVLMYFLFKK